MAKPIKKSDLIKISDFIYEIPASFSADMRVPARIFLSEQMLEDIMEDRSLEQIVNVASLPGIAKYAIAMPDIHQGYGFPIGGVAATVINQGGVISPGGIGYDINCGVRLMAANISINDIQPFKEKLATALFNAVLSGVGRGGNIKMKPSELDHVLAQGAAYMVQKGYGTQRDLEYCESKGCMDIADPRDVSLQAKQRGADQLGTLGSGNHFLEVQYVDELYDKKIAQSYGLSEGQIVVMIHCGSRGLGHQVCTDYVKIMMSKIGDWGIQLPDRELVCAPFTSDEGQAYFRAMAAAANFAWANRHTIGHWVRQAWQEILGPDVTLETVYDVSHNIGKKEQHMINGKLQEVLVHRKGATRAFGPDTPDLPAQYRAAGQPVFIPGTMGTSSYVLAGTQEGMEVAFGSSCHGAGRRLSRVKAKKAVSGVQLRKQLEAQGIVVRCDSDAGLSEEAPIAYKDVDNVVNVVVGAKIAKKVVRVKPVAVIKGG
ncbi:MAG: RtcB family protein [Candidatus Babeliales bacterium]